ncbi:MAG: response regulator [Candidatus Synoicihabitans palmerolidicus]|nr:response regulator [Candidatus Synoicihabitans palmerolidicus]
MADGREAVEAAARNSYDAIIVDMHMPELNGVEVAQAIRANCLNGRTRMVLASASAEPSALPDELFNDFVEKPVNLR